MEGKTGQSVTKQMEKKLVVLVTPLALSSTISLGCVERVEDHAEKMI